MNAEDRNSYIGGPSAATILGVNPWQTPLSLWLQLTGRAPPVEVNDAMRSGMRLERAVLDYAGEVLDTAVLPGPFVRHGTLPLAGHLDGVTAAGDVVEAKTARSKSAWGEPGTGDVPPAYAAQCLHYMGLTGAKTAHLAVLFSGLDFAMYRIERDDTLIEQMRNLCWRWWQDFVLTDTPPPPQSGADAALLFPRDAGKVVIADDATAEAVAKLRAVRNLAKDLESQQEELESRIKLALGDAATLMVGGETAATWKSAKPSMRFDSGAFKAAQPETYQQFCREQSSRRFLLKG
jgi:putative phage-type endonuclease